MKNKIKDISSEVKQLHPLLAELLPKLPLIKDVEYTHGPNEMGADFVLEKDDQTLLDTIYIGVIAKIGKITQGMAEIDRQISECRVERFFKNGKKKIKLSEIWVITTDNITQGAQKVINANHETTNVQFISGEKLARFVDEHIAYYWHDIPSGIGKYLTEQWVSNSEKDKASSLLPSDINFYVDLELIRIDDTTYNKKEKKKEIVIDDEILVNRISYVEADMGGGKSKLLRNIIGKMSTPEHFSETKVVPLYISYKEIVDKYKGSIEQCVDGMLQEVKNDLDNDVDFLVLIDGVDEVISTDKEKVDELTLIISEVKESDNIRAVITSRPLKALEEETVVEKDVKRYAIQPLTISKIISFISNICNALSLPNRLVEDLKKSDLFKQLPRSPIAAILLSRLFSENTKDLPSNLTELYSKSLELMLGRWDVVDKNMNTQKEYEAANNICEELSEYFLENSLIYLSADEAKGYFKRYLERRNLGIDVDDLFHKVISRSGVITEDRTNNTISFKHRSFSEYLYASRKRKSNVSILNDNIFDSYWMNTNFFYIGLYKDCPDLLNDILGYPVTNESERWMKILNMPSYFMAAHQTPYEVVCNNLYKLFIEAANLYKDIREGNTETNLNELPEMQALWLVQYLLRDSYSYAYFEQALDETALKIEENLTNDNEKSYALFFVGCVAIDMGIDEPFNYLLDSIDSSEIPLTIGLALRAEMNAHKELGRSTLMKKHNKKLKKIFKNNVNIQKFAKDLIEKPMKLISRK